MSDTFEMDDELKKVLAAIATEQSYKTLTPGQAIKQKIIKKNRHHYFVAALILAREIKHLTQAKLAKNIGTSRSVIAEAESINGNPSLGTLLKIAEALEVELTVRPRAGG